MKAELDVYNEQGQHVIASFVFEDFDNKSLVELAVRDFVSALAARTATWEDAQENYAMLILADDEPLPGEENEDEQEN